MWRRLVQWQLRECPGSFSPVPKHCRLHRTPPLLCLRPSAKAVWKGFGIVLVLPLTLALNATALHLKTSCPLPSCGQLRKPPLALTPGKNTQ